MASASRPLPWWHFSSLFSSPSQSSSPSSTSRYCVVPTTFNNLLFISFQSHFNNLLLICFILLQNLGLGSEILLYELEFGKIMKSYSVFDGVRVHGISSSSESVIAVFGEKRVKLFSFLFENGDPGSTRLRLIHLLPKFSHWILDVCFLRVSNSYSYFHFWMNCGILTVISDNYLNSSN